MIILIQLILKIVNILLKVLIIEKKNKYNENSKKLMRRKRQIEKHYTKKS